MSLFSGETPRQELPENTAASHPCPQGQRAEDRRVIPGVWALPGGWMVKSGVGRREDSFQGGIS